MSKSSYLFFLFSSASSSSSLPCFLQVMRTRSSRNVAPTSIIKEFSERATHRIRTVAAESIRYSLFALRCEVLWSATRILGIMNRRKAEERLIREDVPIDIDVPAYFHYDVPNSHINQSDRGDTSTNTNILKSVLIRDSGHPRLLFGSTLSDPDMLFSDSDRLSLASYFSAELSVAVADGLTIRTLKVSTYVRA